MAYLFALILICWFLTWFFIFRGKSRDTLEDLYEAQAAMNNAQTPEERYEAAKVVLEIIEEDSLAGIVVDDARDAAQKVLRRGL